jgi:hypothetical protein
MMVPEGRKHSIDISMDVFTKDQRLLGYDSLNLLNAHEDPTYLRSVLYLQAAREFLPAAKANFVRVAINGETWGIYSNVQQVNKTFLKEWYQTDEGTRWKVPGMPGGRGGLEYWGDDVAQYKNTFEIKGKDDPKAWAALVNFTKVLNTTPPDQLAAALAPILDVDGVLRFLALDNALVNNDGYWTRASDYNIYLDKAGKFHILPHDTNETFGPAGGGRGGPGGPGGPGGFGPPPGGGFGPPPGRNGPGRSWWSRRSRWSGRRTRRARRRHDDGQRHAGSADRPRGRVEAAAVEAARGAGTSREVPRVRASDRDEVARLEDARADRDEVSRAHRGRRRSRHAQARLGRRVRIRCRDLEGLC